MELREIPVEELQFGMYVAKLDRPWTETPFVFQGFVLKSEKQLATLKKYCGRVFVDPEKEDLSEVGVSSSAAPTKIRGDTVYKDLASVEAELPRASAAFTETTAVVKQLSRAVEIGNAIDSSRAQEAATQITDSVVRNADALTLLVRMQEKSGEALSRAVEISVMMAIFGRFLQLPRERLDHLGMLGLLQDVGKLKLPGALLTKREPFNAEELELYRTHVTHSVEILSSTTGLPAELSAHASLHHERYDGTGYPRGLRGEAIGLIGMIAGIVDAYDVLTAPAPFGEHLSPSNALSAIHKGRGKQFHPALVEQFVQCLGVFPVGSVVELNSGEIAVVTAQNPLRRLQPRIMVVKDAKGIKMMPYKMLDLMKEPKVRPDEPYRILRSLEYDAVEIDPRELFL
jgi:HD-GYP domain-containing protein (c-di-GMP phosphodiesterase class II)